MTNFLTGGSKRPLFPPLLALILIVMLCGIAAAAQKYVVRQQARHPFSAPSSKAQLSPRRPTFSLQSDLSLTNKADFALSSVVSSQLSINRQSLTVGGSQVLGGLFGPTGTEISVLLGYQTASGGVGIIGIVKQTAN